jgi:rRNA-processing protein FCF1
MSESSVFDALEQQLKRLAAISVQQQSTTATTKTTSSTTGQHSTTVVRQTEDSTVSDNIISHTSEAKQQKKNKKKTPNEVTHTSEAKKQKKNKAKSAITPSTNEAKNNSNVTNGNNKNIKKETNNQKVKKVNGDAKQNGNNEKQNAGKKKKEKQTKTTDAEKQPVYMKFDDHRQQTTSLKPKNKFSKDCIALSNNGIPTIQLANRNMSDSDVIDFVQWLPNSGRFKHYVEKKHRVKMNIEMYDNSITDAGVGALVDFLLAHQEDIRVNALKFWKNSIGDVGAEHLARYITECKHVLVELHLSHNRITTQGAIALFKAVENNPLYPRVQVQAKQKKESADTSSSEATTAATPETTTVQNHCPLWLRLEFNFINLEQLNKQYSLNALNPCYADSRTKCGPNGCCKSAEELHNCKVHLYVFHLQFLKPEESVLLTTAKERIQSIKATKDKKPQTVTSTDSTGSTSSTGTSVEDEMIQSLPTYIFLDTNAVMNMIDTPSFLDGKNSRFGQYFCFKKLIAKASKNQFGSAFNSEGDKVYLILTDTIMQEIDHRKSAETKEWLREAIRRQLQSEKGYLEACCRLGFMTMLGAHQGELLLKTSNMKYFNSPSSSTGNPNLYNDLKLLEVAAFWAQELGITNNVIVVTNDHEVKRRAKQFNIPAESLKNLDTKLCEFSAKNPDAPWTSSVIRSCIGNDVFNTSSSVPIPARSTSIFEELGSASDLVKKFISILDQDHTPDQNNKQELVHEAEEALSRWASILSSKPTLFNNSSSSGASTSSSK